MMTMQANPPPQLTSDDIDHLRWLSIGHYIVGGLSVVCGFFPFIHLSVGIGMLSGQLSGSNPPADAQFVGALFIGIASVMIAMFWITAGLLIYAGRCYVARRKRTLCFVVAVLACVFFQPIGLVLGILSIIVLNRPSVKAAFAEGGFSPRTF